MARNSTRWTHRRAQEVFDAYSQQAVETAAGSIYADLTDNIRALLAGEPNWVANAGNVASLIYHGLPDLNWVGFYFVEGDELVLGPFQGQPACVRLPLGEGVCGAAAKAGQPVNVADVTQFPGHIACDRLSRSELVVPLFEAGRVVGVLDLDSPRVARFGKADEEGCAALTSLLTNRHKDYGNVYPLKRRVADDKAPAYSQRYMSEATDKLTVVAASRLSADELQQAIDLWTATKAENTARENAARATAAPRLKWEHDRRDDENPATFAWRAYAAEAKAGTLHRGVIYSEDRELHRRLNSWLRSHPMPERIDIPTLPEWNSRRIEAAKGKGKPLREVGTEEARLRKAERYRAAKGAHPA